MVTTARTMSRSVGDVYGEAGVTDYSREELIALIEKEHGSLSGIDPDRLGFWRAACSNSSLDSYFTRMAKSSLQNYASDASSPTVAFQNSHRHFELPVGRSVVGQFVNSVASTADPASSQTLPNDYLPAFIGDFYSHRDLQLGEVSVEQFLLGVQAHVVKDVSIGFKEGEGYKNTCSVCSQDYFSWDCRHVAGVEYPVASGDAVIDPTDGDDTPPMQLCFVWIENARLSEVSAVYDGATTNAMIIKAEREARAGRLETDVENYLERRFRFRRDVKTWIKGDRGIYVPEGSQTEDDGGTPNTNRTGEKTMKTEQELAADAEKARLAAGGGDLKDGVLLDAVSPVLRIIGGALGMTLAADADRATLEAEVVRTAKANATKAVKYDALRAAEIDIAIQEKIRAEGDTFDADAQTRTRTMLESIDEIETIRSFTTEWKATGDTRFAGGRRSEGGAGDDETADEAEKAKRNPEISHVPVSKFAGGV